MSLRKQTPSDFLKQIIGRPVVVKLNSGVDYRGNMVAWTYLWRFLSPYIDSCHFPIGVLACLDGYMNIAIEQTEEYVNGQLKNKYGDAFLRGNNGKKPVGGIIYATSTHKIWAHMTILNSKREKYLGKICCVINRNRPACLFLGGDYLNFSASLTQIYVTKSQIASQWNDKVA